MKMYSRDDLLNMQTFGEGDVDDDDDDDDETPFPSKLVRIKTSSFSFSFLFFKLGLPPIMLIMSLLLQGKVLKENKIKSKNWKRRITTGILDVGETIKNHASKVSQRISRWWKAKKGVLKKKTSKSGKAEL